MFSLQSFQMDSDCRKRKMMHKVTLVDFKVEILSNLKICTMIESL